jgi:4-hydroxybenzoate polyprenyltransferase
LPFCAFCLVSSAGYILNDVLTESMIFIIPEKVYVRFSRCCQFNCRIYIYLILFVTGIVLACAVSLRLVLYLSCYAAVSISISLYLKTFPVVDIFSISAGFLIRLLAGGEQFHIPILPGYF